jgi:predicted PurR-regulated permease PerM
MRAVDNPRWLAVLVLASIFLYLCWKMLEPFVSVLLWAIVLVILFFPVFLSISRKTKRPSLSALITILLIIATVIIPFAAVSIAVANQLTHMVGNLQQSVQQSLADPVKGAKIQKLIDAAKQYIDVESLKDYVGKISQSVLKGTINVVGGVIGAVVKVFFIIFTMFYLFRDGERIAERLPDQFPLRREKAIHVLNHTKDIISASVYGVLVIALVQGVLGGLMFWILGIPSALVWGVLMTLLSTIPMAGAFVVWVPAATILVLTGHWIQALILTIWGALVIGSIDNFLRPKLVGQKAKMHELVIFFSVLGGLSVFGVIGILLGPVIVAVTIALLEVLSEKADSIADGTA